VPAIAKIAFTSEDRVREAIHNFNARGFDSLAPMYAGGRRPKFILPDRQASRRWRCPRPQDHNLPFSTWSLSKLTEILVAEGGDDISHKGPTPIRPDRYRCRRLLPRLRKIGHQT
jgi:hypothetical protein